jgi:hypothetical protein
MGVSRLKQNIGKESWIGGILVKVQYAFRR